MSSKIEIDAIAIHDGEQLLRVPGSWKDAMDILIAGWDDIGDNDKPNERGRWCWIMTDASGCRYACSGSNGKEADVIVEIE